MGKRFPHGYHGCLRRGAKVAPYVFYCETGGRVVTFARHYWAVAGKPVHHARSLGKDRGYRAALSSCTA